MSKETILIVISAMIGSPIIGAVIKYVFEKRKTTAEVSNLHITGEISIGEAWAKYAIKIENDFKELTTKFEKLSGEFYELNNNFHSLRREKESLAKETEEKDKKIAELIARIEVLEKEIEKYKTTSHI